MTVQLDPLQPSPQNRGPISIECALDSAPKAPAGQFSYRPAVLETKRKLRERRRRAGRGELTVPTPTQPEPPNRITRHRLSLAVPGFRPQ